MINTTIQAIPTRFDGRYFRSRLEARWAAYFNALDIRYDYEPEGFQADGLRYLPDFWLPKIGLFAEIKPADFTWDQIQKAMILPHDCILISGAPNRDVALFPTTDFEYLIGMHYWPDEYSGEAVGIPVREQDYVDWVSNSGCHIGQSWERWGWINLEWSNSNTSPKRESPGRTPTTAALALPM